MKPLLFIITFILTLHVHGQQRQEISEIDLIIAPLQRYLDGHIKGDSQLLGSALHTQGKLSYISKGEHRQLIFSDYLNGMKLRNTDDVIKRIPYVKSIDLTGDVAIGKLVLDYSSRLFTDYMTLLKINGEWKITNKIAYSVADPKNSKALQVDMPLLLRAIKRFAQAYQSADSKKLMAEFDADAKVMSNINGQYRTKTISNFVADLSAASAKSGRLAKYTIQNVDATGNVAIGKIVFHYPETTQTQYLSLLKVAGEWKIVNSAINAEAKH